MAEAPNVLNYYVGKGIVSFQPGGVGDFRDVGNVPVFEFTPAIEKLDHFSSRAGVRTKDRSIVLEKSATVRIVMEEWVGENLAMALLGDLEVNTAGDSVIDIFSRSEVQGALKFVGTNEVGAQVDILLHSVSFIPGASLTPISDEWGQIEVTGEVNFVEGLGFGTLTHRAENSSA